MFGLILALLYATWVLVFGNAIPEVAYLKATGFLYGWYVVWTWILGVFVGLIALIMMLGGTAAGASKGGGKIGAIIGTVLGGGLSGLIVFLFAVRRALYVGGAYLLAHALTRASPWHWNKAYLILGSLLLLVAFVTAARSRAQRSRSRDD
ncbi:MAG: hypothetical protein Q7R80_02395 [bacterium]|nr:hypothetical protein [bacterium]